MPRSFTTKLVGVSFDNQDGSSRQIYIRKHATAGKSILLRAEPDNPYDKNAIGAWIPGDTEAVQIGYLDSRLAGEVRRLLERGGNATASITRVVGGTPGYATYGVVISFRKYEPGEAIAPEKQTKPMKNRTKWFLGTLIAASVIGDLASGANGKIIAPLAVCAVLIWLAWRAFVGLYRLCAPLRKAIKPQTDNLNQHIDTTLRRSGLGAMVDFGNKIDAGVIGAINTTQKQLDERNGHSEPAAPTPETHVRCPDCAELVRREARVCKHCHCKLIPQ